MNEMKVPIPDKSSRFHNTEWMGHDDTEGIYRQGENEEEYVDTSKLFFFRSEESTLF